MCALPHRAHILAFDKSGGFSQWEARGKLRREGTFVVSFLSFQDLFVSRAYEHFACVYVCPRLVAREGQKRAEAMYMLGLEFQTVASCHVGAGTIPSSSGPEAHKLQAVPPALNLNVVGSGWECGGEEGWS